MNRTAGSLNTYFDTYRHAVLFQGNGHAQGFHNKLYASNREQATEIESGKDYLAFINYDYKNKLEVFNEKNTNPLVFPNQVLIEAEEIIPLENLALDDSYNEHIKLTVKPTVSREKYIETVTRLKQHIQQGDIYEMNYCITFEAHNVVIDPINLYRKLNAISNAPYSALAKLDHQYIICSSPELYVTKTGTTLASKPIKGTARRGSDEQEDLLTKTLLQNSLKERTENVMIVDVVRNDFSKLAKKGTVNVEKLYNIETYEQVHQMVSTVTCEVDRQASFEAILRATFPMASMTGAPKIRAMQLADDYELYNRGPYSGALGYVTAQNDVTLNVLIRSIFYDREKQYLSFSVGSAITALCKAEEEFDECLLKAKAMMQVLEQ